MLSSIPGPGLRSLLRCSHEASLSQARRRGTGAGARPSSPLLQTDAETTCTTAASLKQGRIAGSTQVILPQQPSVSVGSARGGLARRFSSSSSSSRKLLSVSFRSIGHLVPSLALPQAFSERSLSSKAEESPVADDDAESASSRQASTAAATSRGEQLGSYTDVTSQAWSTQQQPRSDKGKRRVQPDDRTIASARRIYCREMQRRRSKGLEPHAKIVSGLVRAWATLAASQGKTLAPPGIDDDSLAAAFRIRRKAWAEVSRLRNRADARPDEVSQAQSTKEKWAATFLARLRDPANIKEREVYQVWIKQQNQRAASRFIKPERVLERLRQYANTPPVLTSNGSIVEVARLRDVAMRQHTKAHRAGAEPALLALLHHRLLGLRELYQQRYRDPRNADEAEAIGAQRKAMPATLRASAKAKAEAAARRAAKVAKLEERGSSEDD